MGSYFSKIGSDPYYAGYERSFESLKASIEKLQVSSCSSPTFSNKLVPLLKLTVLCPAQDKLSSRHKHVAAVDGTIFMYGLAGFAIAAGLAAWVSTAGDQEYERSFHVNVPQDEAGSSSGSRCCRAT